MRSSIWLEERLRSLERKRSDVGFVIVRANWFATFRGAVVVSGGRFRPGRIGLRSTYV